VVAVFPTGADGNQASDIPFTIRDQNSKTGLLFGAYAQDEWKAVAQADRKRRPALRPQLRLPP